MSRRFDSPQDAERAFYAAFERADLDAMMSVWAHDEQIICIHPGGGRRCGPAAVRESWRQIFAQGPQLRFRLADERLVAGKLMSVHSVFEYISVAGQSRPPAAVLATNIYILTGAGWRMLMHHAGMAGSETAGPPPDVLH